MLHKQIKFIKQMIAYNTLGILLTSLIIVSTFAIWLQLKQNERYLVENQINAVATVAFAPLPSILNSYVNETNNFAKHWQLEPTIDENKFKQEAQLILNQLSKSYMAIAYIDNDLSIKWNVNKYNNDYYKSIDLKKSPIRYNALMQAKATQQITVTKIFKLFSGDPGFIIVAPIIMNKSVRAYIYTVVDANSLFKQMFQNGFDHDFGIAVYQDDQVVYATPDQVQALQYVKSIKLLLKDNIWQVYAWPTEKLFNRIKSSSPDVVIALGILMSVFMLAIFYYYNKARLITWRMLEARKQALLFSERLEKVMSKINEGCVIVDDKFNIVYWNTYLEKLSQWQAEEVAGKNIFDVFIPEKNREFYKQNFRKIFEFNHLEVFNREVEINTIKRDGTKTPVQIISTPIHENGKAYIYTFVRDITQRRHAEADQARMAAIINASQDAVVSIDMQGQIITWNQGAKKLYGYEADEVLGKCISILYNKSTQKKWPKMLDSIHQGNNLTFIDTVRVTKEGELKPVSDSITPIFNNKAVIVGAASIARDISESKEIDRMKSEFISIVSHELRTPLTAIKGSLSLLLNGKIINLTEAGRKMLQIGADNAERLIRLINDMLDVEKISANMINYNMQCLSMKRLANVAIESSQSIAERHHVTLLLNCEDDPHIYADEDRIIQVLVNLLSNAIRYANEGSVVAINIKTSNAMVYTAVNNHGSVIPESFRSHIFKKFSQADSSDRRKKGGTGLGLNICKSIIEAHQGTIGFTSDITHGTTFFFNLPQQL